MALVHFSLIHNCLVFEINNPGIFFGIQFSIFNLPKIKALAFAMDINEALKSEQDQITEALGKFF